MGTRKLREAALKFAFATAATEIEVHRESLKAIKALVCGDRNPNWTDDWATTHTRGRIADICDGSLCNQSKVSP